MLYLRIHFVERRETWSYNIDSGWECIDVVVWTLEREPEDGAASLTSSPLPPFGAIETPVSVIRTRISYNVKSQRAKRQRNPAE